MTDKINYIKNDHLKSAIEDIGEDRILSLQAQFKAEVDDRAEEVDPSNEQDWFSLTLGWALAKGLSPDEADTFATYIRYRTSLA